LETVMNDKVQAQLNEDEVLDILLEPYEYYELLATPLKQANAFKEEHRQCLKEMFQFNEFGRRMNKGFDLIIDLLPEIVGRKAWEKLAQEFAERDQHAQQYLSQRFSIGENGEPPTVQRLWGISDDSLLHIYNLGRQLLEDEQFDQADAVFTVLSYLNPNIPEYALGKGIALYSIGNYKDAAEMLQVAKTLLPNKVAPFLYSALCQTVLQNTEEVDKDLAAIEEIMKKSSEERDKWNDILKVLIKKETGHE
jgi:tetratricopeptide (TPR) repeat protein